MIGTILAVLSGLISIVDKILTRLGEDRLRTEGRNGAMAELEAHATAAMERADAIRNDGTRSDPRDILSRM